MAIQDKTLGKRRLNSGILGASVGNLSISGLSDEVVFELRNDGPIPVSNFSPVERLAVNMKQILDLTNSRKTLRPSVFSGTSHQTVGFFQLFLSFESQLLNHCMYVTYLPPPPLPPTDGSGGWSSDGCSVHNTTKDNVTVCGCNHLTSFAILLVRKQPLFRVRFLLIVLWYVQSVVTLFCLLPGPLQRRAN